jgi:hypothetical protein
MLKNLVPIKCLSLNKPRRWKCWLGGIYSIFIIHYFWSLQKVMYHWVCWCTM